VSTIRVARRNRFTTIDRRTVRDDRLSFKALGVLVWLLDHPDDWQIDTAQIGRLGRKEGRDAVRSAMRELEDHGYVHRRKYRNERGQWVHETVVYESPLTSDDAANPQVSPETPLPSSADRASAKAASSTEDGPTEDGLRNNTMAAHAAHSSQQARAADANENDAPTKDANARGSVDTTRGGRYSNETAFRLLAEAEGEGRVPAMAKKVLTGSADLIAARFGHDEGAIAALIDAVPFEPSLSPMRWRDDLIYELGFSQGDVDRILQEGAARRVA
jgi:hypothetical protein